MVGGEEGTFDCFVSFAEDGRRWAEWITFALERGGQRVVNAAWDQVPGTHRVAWLDAATRNSRYTIAVVSDGYLNSPEALAEWGAAWSPPIAGPHRPLLVARVTERPIPGLLGQIAAIDLAGRGERAAETALLAAVPGGGGEGLAAARGRPVEFPGAAGRPVFPAELPAVWNVPRPAARFVGRTDKLDHLDAALGSGGLVAVTGLAGIGKTSLAAEYVSRHRLDFQAVWWVPAGRPGQIEQQVRALAPDLGLPAQAEPAAVLARLDEAGGRWLLVLDDAGDAARLPAWLRPSEGAGRVLVTSRGSALDWDRRLDGAWNGRVVELGPLERGESVALLADRLPAVDRTLAGRVAERLGDHPLALDQAAHRLIDVHGQVEDYLAELTANPAGTLGEGRAPGRPDVTTATLWNEAIRRLDADSPAAAVLLRLAAHGDAGRLPLRLLTADPAKIPDAGLRAATASPMALAATTAALERAGLAHRDGDALTTHTLVRAAVRTHTTPEQAAELVDGLGRMLHAALPADVTTTPDAWPPWRELLPHAQAVLEATDPAADTPHTAWLAEHTAAYLTEQGHPEQAEPLAARAVTARERLDGPDHPDTLTARETHLRAALGADHLAVAGPLAERNAADRERVLGPDHPDTLTSRESLARTYQRAGHLDHAQALFERNLADRARDSSPGDPATLECRHDLGVLHADRGQDDEAIGLLRPILSERQQVLGIDHPDTLGTRHHLAIAYRRIGATGDALAQAETALAGRERALGPDHPDTLDTRHQLAITYRQAGRVDDATRELDRTLADRERVLGPDHARTLDSTQARARFHLDAGRPDQALPLLDRTLAGRERHPGLGPDHPETVRTRLDIGEAHGRLGNPRDAVPHLEQVLDWHERALGAAHPRTADTRVLLAGIYRSTGQFEAARPLLERHLTDQIRAHGVADARTLSTADALADTCRCGAGRLPQAVDLHERVHAIRVHTLGSDHPDTRRSRDALADTYREVGRARDALPLHQNAFREAMRYHGPMHTDTLRARRTLAETTEQARYERITPPEQATQPDRPVPPEYHPPPERLR
ncbi:tetratricopeptide repeat protein [Frankia canadensis]|nr:tetratricopeptide repeat protein [Frankia canadensis]